LFISQNRETVDALDRAALAARREMQEEERDIMFVIPQGNYISGGNPEAGKAGPVLLAIL